MCNSTKLKAAAAYGRYSSHLQNEQSIEGQFSDIYAKAKQEGYTIIKEYVDEAMTGRNDKRPAFQQMIQDSEKGLFEAVFVWAIDRFARDRYLAAIYKHQLRKNGVKLLYAVENIPNGPEGIMLEGVLESVAEYFSEYNAQKVLRGKRETALKGKYNGGGILWGYLLDENKHFKIDKKVAPIIKDIFELYATGVSSLKIADKLNDSGIKTMFNTRWDNRKVLQLLKHKGYGGYYCWGDFCLENKIPAIVDKKIFEMVQEKMKKNKAKAATFKAKEYYILSGKLFCGKCDKKMVGNRARISRKTNQKTSYYQCSGKKLYKECDLKSFRKEFVEDLVISEIKNFLSDSKRLEIIAEKIASLLEQDTATEKLSDALKAQLTDVEKSLKNLLLAIEKGIFSEITQNRLTELEAQKKDLILKIRQEELAEQQPIISKEQILFFLKRFKTFDTDDIQTKEMLIETFVNKIYIDENTLRIIFNISDKNNDTKIDLKTIQQTEKERKEDDSFNVLDTTQRRSSSDDSANRYKQCPKESNCITCPQILQHNE